MSKKGGADNDAAELQAIIAQRLWEQTNPVRNQYLGTIKSDLNTYAKPESIYRTPAYGAAKMFTEKNYAQGLDNARAMMPRGGVLFDKLGDLNESRSQTLTGTLADLWSQQSDLSKQRASTAAFGTPGTTMAGLGSAAAAEAQQNAAAQQSQAAMGQGVGSLAGQLGGAYILGKMLS